MKVTLTNHMAPFFNIPSLFTMYRLGYFSKWTYVTLISVKKFYEYIEYIRLLRQLLFDWINFLNINDNHSYYTRCLLLLLILLALDLDWNPLSISPIIPFQIFLNLAAVDAIAQSVS
jgi:hypothetical protein